MENGANGNGPPMRGGFRGRGNFVEIIWSKIDRIENVWERRQCE